MPTACMNAWQMTGPQNLKPALRSVFAMRSLSGDDGRMSAGARRRLTFVAWSTCCQSRSRNAPRPPASMTRSHARALAIAPSILARLRTMPSSRSRRATSREPYRATFAGSKPSNARRKAGRLRRMVIQLRPAWKPSSTSFS